MKTLTGVAVYGLVPVPPMPDAQSRSDNDNQPPTAGDANAARIAGLQRDSAERMATNDEIARKWPSMLSKWIKLIASRKRAPRCSSRVSAHL